MLPIRPRTPDLKSLLALLLGVCLLPMAAGADSCVDCHKNPDFRVHNKKLYDYYSDWMRSTHKKAGVSCTNCHGGDPTQTGAEAAHNGGFLPSNPESSIHFKNLPATCGGCHEQVFVQFTESQHYKALLKEQNAPHCVTCHGSINSKVYYTSIVEPTCMSCHNHDRPGLPDVADQAEEILQRLNIAKAYMGWTAIYYQSTDQSHKINGFTDWYQRIADSWHKFKLAETDDESKELYARLKAVFDQAWQEKFSGKPPPGGGFMVPSEKGAEAQKGAAKQ